MIETHLYERLKELVPGSCLAEDTILMSDYLEGETFAQYVERLELKMSDLGDCFINGTLAKPSDILSDGDRIALFPFNMRLLCGGQHIKGHGYTDRDIDVDYY